MSSSRLEAILLGDTSVTPQSRIEALIKELVTGQISSGDVDDAVSAAIAELVDSAPEDLNTLKELADWISSHEETYSALAGLVEEKIDRSELSNYATVVDLSSAVSALHSELSSYATVSSVGAAFSALYSELTEYATVSAMSSAVQELSSAISSVNTKLSEYATVSALSSAVEDLSSDIASVSAKFSEYATVSAMSSAVEELSSAISSVNTKLSEYATVSALSSAVSDIQSSLSNLSEYATVSALSSAISDLSAIKEDVIIPEYVSVNSVGPHTLVKHEGSVYVAALRQFMTGGPYPFSNWEWVPAPSNVVSILGELLADIAYPYYAPTSSSVYNTGDLALSKGTLYQCKEDNVYGDWNSSKWKYTTLSSVIKELSSSMSQLSEYATVSQYSALASRVTELESIYGEGY